MIEATERAGAAYTAALEDDLNTAEARAAIFDLVRLANSCADRGELLEQNVAPILEALERFDQVFQVIDDVDESVRRRALEWAEKENRLADAAPDLVAGLSLSDEEIESRIAERNAARAARDFTRADAIRNELADKGILIEDRAEGVRWRRK